MGEVENFEMEPEVPALPVGYNFVALVVLIILFKKPEVNRLRNDRDIAVWKFCIELNARGLGD